MSARAPFGLRGRLPGFLTGLSLRFLPLALLGALSFRNPRLYDVESRKQIVKALPLLFEYDGIRRCHRLLIPLGELLRESEAVGRHRLGEPVEHGHTAGRRPSPGGLGGVELRNHREQAHRFRRRLGLQEGREELLIAACAPLVPGRLERGSGPCVLEIHPEQG